MYRRSCVLWIGVLAFVAMLGTLAVSEPVAADCALTLAGSAIVCQNDDTDGLDLDDPTYSNVELILVEEEATVTPGMKGLHDVTLNIKSGGEIAWSSGGPFDYAVEGNESGNVSVNNAGTIDTSSDTNWAVVLRGDNNSISNTGTIFGVGLSGDNSTLSNESNGTISWNGDDAVLADSLGTIENSGLIEATGEESSGVTVTGTGGTTTITNTGTIRGGQYSIRVDSGSPRSVELTNESSGVLYGDVHFSSGADTVTNEGTIRGNVSLSAGRDELNNSGIIEGNVTTGNGADTVHNDYSAWIYGDVHLGAGRDELENNGVIDGDVRAGSGNDTITNYAEAEIEGDVHLGGGTNTLDNYGTIDGAVTGGSGADIVSNEGDIEDSVDLGDGENVVMNSGRISGSVTGGEGLDAVSNYLDGVIDGDVALGAGENVVLNSGRIVGAVSGGDDDDTVANFLTAEIKGDVDLGAGENTVTNEGRIVGAVTGGSDDDTVTNEGEIEGDVDLGDGSNELENSGDIGGDVTAGSGDDTITNYTDAAIGGNVHLADGTNTLDNYGTIGGAVTGGSGDDTVTNEGEIDEDVDLGDGSNRLENNGDIGGDVTAGSGADIITNHAEAEIEGDVDLDGGTNTLNNSGIVDGTVTGGEGIDRVYNYAGGVIEGDVHFGDGANLLENSGDISGDVIAGSGGDTIFNEEGAGIKGDINLGDGTNTVTNLGRIGGAVTGGSGGDTVTNQGEIEGDVALGDGTNGLTNQGGIDGSVKGGSGDDTITNESSATIRGDVDLGDGSNKLQNDGRIDGAVIGGSETDELENKGEIRSHVHLGDGDNVLNNTGRIGGNVTGGSGRDEVTTQGVVSGNVDLGGGNNFLHVGYWGKVHGNVVSGDGQDQVTVDGDVTGAITTGGGDDIVTINSIGFVGGNVHLGDGADQLELVGWDGNQIVDVRDGGAGNEDQLILDGGEGTLETGDFRNFENVTVTGGGRWTIRGSIPTSGGAATSSSLAALLLKGDDNVVTYDTGSTLKVTAAEGRGVLIDGDQNRFTNDGDIDVSGSGAKGIAVLGQQNVVRNNSTDSLRVSGTESVGVEVGGQENRLENPGAIHVLGNASRGVRVGGTQNTVLNTATGAIEVGGNATVGVELLGEAHTFTNQGRVTVWGQGPGMSGVRLEGVAHALKNERDAIIEVLGDQAIGVNMETALDQKLHNAGTIVAAGAGARGVSVSGFSGVPNLIENAGVIRAEGEEAVGVVSSGGSEAMTWIVNRGVIEASLDEGEPESDAYLLAIVGEGESTESIENQGIIRGSVVLGGGRDSLTLAAGSSLEHGDIDLGEGDDDLYYSTQVATQIGADRTITGGAGHDTITLTGNGHLHLYTIEGFETLALEDAGTWQFHESVSFTDPVTADEGHLILGSREGEGITFAMPALTIGSDARLSGTGTIKGDVTIEGSVAPGYSTGTLVVDGDYTQADGSIYEIEIGRDGTTDRIDVTGQATIGDDTAIAISAEYGYYDPSRRFEVLKADGGVMGEFDEVDWDIELLFLGPEAKTEEDRVYVELAHLGPGFEKVARTENQKAVARALDQLESKGVGEDVLHLVLPALNEADARKAYDSLAGEIYAQHRFHAIMSMAEFMQGPLTTLGDGQDGRGVFVSAYGGRVNLRPMGDKSGADFGAWGIAAGYELARLPDMRFGVAVGTGVSDVTMEATKSKGEAQNQRVGLYAHYARGRLGLRGIVAYGRDRNTYRRELELLGHAADDRTAQGEFGSSTVAVKFEGDLSYETEHLAIRPLAGLSWYSVNREEFTETGADAANLKLREDTYALTQAVVGVELGPKQIEEGQNAYSLRLLHVRNLSGFVARADASFASAPEESFPVLGGRPGDSGFVVNASLRRTWGDSQLALGYSGESWDNATQHTVTVRFDYKF